MSHGALGELLGNPEISNSGNKIFAGLHVNPHSLNGFATRLIAAHLDRWLFADSRFDSFVYISNFERPAS